MRKPDTSYLLVRNPPEMVDDAVPTRARRARPRPSSGRDRSDKVRESHSLVEQIVEYRRLRTGILQEPKTPWSDVERLAELDAKFIEPVASERRRCRRFRCNLLSWLRRPETPGQVDIVFVSDLGAHGAKIAHNPGLEVGEEVSLTFRVGDAGSPRVVTFDARVVRLGEGVGLRFGEDPVAMLNAA